MLYKRCPCAESTKCGHPYWFCFEMHGRRYRRSTKTANLRLAEKTEIKAQNAVLEDANGLTKPKIVKLSTHVERYLAHTAKTNTTAYKDRAVLDRLQDIVGDRPLPDIRPFDLERWKTTRAEEVERTTVNRELNIVRGCFSRALDWGLLAVSPAKVVKNYKVDGARIRVLNDDELRTVLALEDPFVVLVCRATLESLARISELLGLHRQHVGPTWIELRRKGGAVDRVQVTPELRTALLHRCHAVSGAIFGEGELGIPPTQQTASNRVIRALEAAGVLDASHHTMRHTGVTIMLEKGVNPRTIQKLAGWGSLRMLERYGHSRDAEAMRAVREVSTHIQAVSTSEPTTKSATVDQ